MQKTLYILFLVLLFFSYSAQKPAVLATYKKCNGLSNYTMYLYKDGTFLTRLSGGCDGRLESKGKWKINRDTLHFTNIESRMMDDPWKASDMDQKYLIKSKTLTAFLITDNKIVLDENECYKKVKK